MCFMGATNQHTLSDEQTELITSFANKMRMEAIANSHKGDLVLDWKPNSYQLFAEIAYHMAKLNKAILEVERGNVASAKLDVDEFAADVGLYLAKVTETFGTVRIENNKS